MLSLSFYPWWWQLQFQLPLTDLRHSCLVGMKSTWSASELSHNPIMYSWGCSISACTSTLFYVLLMAIYSLFVRWPAGSYISRSRNKNLCCVRSVSFNCVRSFLRFPLVFTSLRMTSLSLSSAGVSLLSWMNNVCSCWLVIVTCKTMEIVNANAKGGGTNKRRGPPQKEEQDH